MIEQPIGNEMPLVANLLDEKNEEYLLCETKPFQQARERSYLQCPSTLYPCRMKMKEAGWFLVRGDDHEFIAVCLYCQKACQGWNGHHDPYKVHRFLSPECVFVLFARATQTSSSSSIVESVGHREQVRPSSHPMAILPTRVHSFQQWPLQSHHPSFDVLADGGLFYTGHNTLVECFSCHGQTTILRDDDNPMVAHTNGCKYARHLRNHSSRDRLHIQSSNKTYQLDTHQVNGTTLYYLQCRNSSTPGILLSAKIVLPNEQELEALDKDFKRLNPIDRHHRKINRMTSSDGALVNILKTLAINPINLTTLIGDLRCPIEEPSSFTMVTTATPDFRCKACFTHETSPHIVPVRCGHLGLCLRECASKWSTCVVCGYTLGKAMRIYHV